MIRATVCALAALSLAGCGLISRPIVSTPPARCASLIPDSWSLGVEGVAVPDIRGMEPLEALRAMSGAYVGESGQREKANGRTADTIAIVQKCEDLVNAARADQ